MVFIRFHTSPNQTSLFFQIAGTLQSQIMIFSSGADTAQTQTTKLSKTQPCPLNSVQALNLNEPYDQKLPFAILYNSIIRKLLRR